MKKIKIGDNVKVILGRDRGKIGKIKTLFHKKGKVIIEGINTKIKHVKPSKKDELKMYPSPVYTSSFTTNSWLFISGVTTVVIFRLYFIAKSKSRWSWAGQPKTAPNP